MNVASKSPAVKTDESLSVPRLGSPKAPGKTDYKPIVNKNGNCIRCIKHLCDKKITTLDPECEGRLKSHLEVCEDKNVLRRCDHCKKDDVELNFKDWLEHVGQCPEKFVTCSQCNYELQYREMLEHEKLCKAEVFFDNKILTRCDYTTDLDGKKSGIVVYGPHNWGSVKYSIYGDLKESAETFLYVIIPNKLLHRQGSDLTQCQGVTFRFLDLNTLYFQLSSLDLVISKKSPHFFGVGGSLLTCQSMYHDEKRTYFEADVISADGNMVQSLPTANGAEKAIFGNGLSYGRSLSGSKPEETPGDFVALKLTINMNVSDEE